MKNKKQKLKGLNLNESLVFVFSTYIYYYCLLCVAATIIVLIVVIVSGNPQPVLEAFKKSTESSIIIAIGTILFIPVTLWRNKYIKQLKSKRNK